MSQEGMPLGIVAVIRAATTTDAIEIGIGLAAAGVQHLEVTLTVPNAVAAIRELRKGSAQVGAGTVLTAQQASEAVDAGATFLVSPSTELEVLRYGRDANVPVISGALTPTEISHAVAAGASAIKLFPIGSVGGPSYVKAISEPFPGVPWVVSGGITTTDVPAYREQGCAAICLGSALIDRDALIRGDRDAFVAHASHVLSTLGTP